MKELMEILNASTLNDLPPFCRSFWDDDEEFVDWFVSIPDDNKIDVVADCVKRCLDLNIRDTYNCLRMLMYCAKGSGNEYEDATPPSTPPPEVQSITIPTIEIPVPEVPKVKRGRGRPPKYATANDHRCLLCECGLSSHGALFNHYKSKQHIKKVMDVLNFAREVVKRDTGKKLKLNVNVVNRRDDPKLSVEDPCEEDIDNLVDYTTDKVNPISDILLVEGMEMTAPSGKKYFSWKKIQ